jgi:hypothetical protein
LRLPAMNREHCKLIEDWTKDSKDHVGPVRYLSIYDNPHCELMGCSGYTVNWLGPFNRIEWYEFYIDNHENAIVYIHNRR